MGFKSGAYETHPPLHSDNRWTEGCLRLSESGDGVYLIEKEMERETGLSNPRRPAVEAGGRLVGTSVALCYAVPTMARRALLRNQSVTDGAPAKHQSAITGSQMAQPSEEVA
jgi:hypothetical protein